VKVLVDIGAHFGEGYDRLAEHLGIDESWTVHHFEPNPISMAMLLQRFVESPIKRVFHCLAVGKPSLTSFYLQRDVYAENEYTLDGYGSCLADSGSTERGMFATCTVCVVSLARIFDYIKFDELHVKIDIEGTEYALDWESVPAGTHCYVEWHKFGTPDPQTAKERIIACRPDIVWHDWD
jgi:FkbM family methyltransferase